MLCPDPGAMRAGHWAQPLPISLLRVKTAVARKEENVSSLRKQYEVSRLLPLPFLWHCPGTAHPGLLSSQAAVQRADHLEALLEQQRRQLLAAE